MNLRRIAFPKPRPKAKPAPKRLRRSSPPARRVRIARVSAKRGQVVKADAEWSAKVRERDREECQLRGHATPVRGEEFGLLANVVLRCIGGLDAHHVYSKKARPRLRYDLDNGLALCRAHHEYAHTAEGKVYVQRFLYSTRPFRWDRLGEKAKREARLS